MDSQNFLIFNLFEHHHGQFEEKEIQNVFEENPYEGEEGLLPQVERLSLVFFFK